MNDALWYLTRATGIVATLLIAAAVISGFLFSGRETGTRRRPNWWLDLHNMLGGLALIFTIVVVVITLSGSLWVMYHMNHNMMPGMMHDMHKVP